MKIIVPMAGMGKRMRPHTLTIPKPLIPVAGKPIVQRLVEDITSMCGEKVEEIAYVIGDFGKEVEHQLVAIATALGAKGTIHYQREPLGTAHAILCAESALSGKVVVAFADTLFRAEFNVASAPANADGVIWVKAIEDPRAFGVVKVDKDNFITDFVEKPQQFVSDLAIIGIYYFNDGDNLRSELQYLIDNDIKDKGEYQLTNALHNMQAKGKKFVPGKVDEWLDCGNKDATVYTNQRVLEFNKNEKLVSAKAKLTDTIIIPPCYIGDDVEITASVIGPHVSLGDGTIVTNSIISNAIIQQKTTIKGAVINNTMLGSHVVVEGNPQQLSLGDYSTHS